MEKLNLFCLTGGLITLVFIDVKRDEFFLNQKLSFKIQEYKIGLGALSTKKLEPQVILWSFFLLKLLFISIDLPYWLAWNAILMSGLVIYRYYLVHVHLNLKSDSTLSFSRDVHSSFSRVAWFFFPFTARLYFSAWRMLLFDLCSVWLYVCS